MGKVGDNQFRKRMSDEKIAYTITAGYYPELASRIKFGGSPLIGKGGTIGAKYAEKRGFSSSSIRRIKQEAKYQKPDKETGELTRGKGLKQQFLPPEFQYEVEILGKKHKREGKAGIQKEDGSYYPSKWFRGQGKGTPIQKEMMSANDREKAVSYSKWMGGGELYKLYGSKVWYMEGMRDRKSLSTTLTEWSKALQDGKTGEFPKNFLNEVYSRSESGSSGLVSLAKELAADLFGESIDKAHTRRKLESIKSGGDYDVPEENVAEAAAEMGKGWARMSKEGNINMDERSWAQKLDALTKFDNKSNLYIDSTEVAFTEEFGHGIMRPSEEVAEAINNLDLDDEGNPNTQQLHELERLIADFMIKNIKQDYNPSIKKLKDYAAGMLDEDPDNITNYRQVLDAVDEHRKELKKMLKRMETSSLAGSGLEKEAKRNIAALGYDAKGPNISVANVAAAMGMDLVGKPVWKAKKGKFANPYEKFTNEKMSNEGFKYVIHMLANLGDEVSRYFAQGHRLATLPDNSKLFASIPMGVDPASMLFYEVGKRTSPEGTRIVRGASHLLAMAAAKDKIGHKQQYVTNARQFQATSHNRIIGHSSRTHKTARLDAINNAKGKCAQPATVVTAYPRGLEAKFAEIMGYFQRDAKNPHWTHKSEAQQKWAANVESKMKKRMKAWPVKGAKKKMNQRQQNMGFTKALSGNKFWALPYIGIVDNVYRGTGHKQL